jgi:ribosomal protein S18 acetylase RimI-like enzyme
VLTTPPYGSTDGRYAAPMSVPIVRAKPDRVAELAELLGGAFIDDPMLVWPFGAGRADAITGFFRAVDERIAAYGWLWEAGDGLGVAAWIPPGSDEAMLDIDRSIRPALTGAEARHAELWDWIAGNFPDEPFWYLDHIAVKADRRGGGLGAALIHHGLAFAERDGVPAFLETGRPENVGYYERRGFRTVADDDAPGGGPHIWFMRYDS